MQLISSPFQLQVNPSFSPFLAEDAQAPLWDFAVSLQEFRQARITDNLIRWLICKGFVQQGIAEEPSQGKQRSFKRRVELDLVQSSWFILTPAGVTGVDANAGTPAGVQWFWCIR